MPLQYNLFSPCALGLARTGPGDRPRWHLRTDDFLCGLIYFTVGPAHHQTLTGKQTEYDIKVPNNFSDGFFLTEFYSFQPNDNVEVCFYSFCSTYGDMKATKYTTTGHHPSDSSMIVGPRAFRVSQAPRFEHFFYQGKGQSKS